jgi:hypothetical protein
MRHYSTERLRRKGSWTSPQKSIARRPRARPQSSSRPLAPQARQATPISQQIIHKAFSAAANLALTATLKHTGVPTIANLISAGVQGYKVYREKKSVRAGIKAAFSDFANREIALPSTQLRYLYDPVGPLMGSLRWGKPIDLALRRSERVI